MSSKNLICFFPDVLPRNFNPQDNYIEIKWGKFSSSSLTFLQFFFLHPEYSQPTIKCPEPIVTHLQPGFDKVLVQVPQPTSSLDPRHVSSEPKLINGSLEVPIGQHWIRFKAVHPISGQFTECNTYVAVKKATST